MSISPISSSSFCIWARLQELILRPQSLQYPLVSFWGTNRFKISFWGTNCSQISPISYSLILRHKSLLVGGRVPIISPSTTSTTTLILHLKFLQSPTLAPVPYTGTTLSVGVPALASPLFKPRFSARSRSRSDRRWPCHCMPPIFDKTLFLLAVFASPLYSRLLLRFWPSCYGLLDGQLIFIFDAFTGEEIKFPLNPKQAKVHFLSGHICRDQIWLLDCPVTLPIVHATSGDSYFHSNILCWCERSC